MKWTSTRRRQVVKPQRKWCWTNTSPRSWQLLSHWGCRGQGFLQGILVGAAIVFGNLGSRLKQLELIWIWIMLESDKLLWLLPVANVNSYLRGRGLLSFPARCSCLSGDILFRMPPQKPSTTQQHVFMEGEPESHLPEELISGPFPGGSYLLRLWPHFGSLLGPQGGSHLTQLTRSFFGRYLWILCW
jgi:hypothetical protein